MENENTLDIPFGYKLKPDKEIFKAEDMYYYGGGWNKISKKRIGLVYRKSHYATFITPNSDQIGHPKDHLENILKILFPEVL